MAKKKIEIFHSMVNINYRFMWQISALSDDRYRVAIISDKRGVIDEVTYRGGFYEQCLTMNQTVSDSGEKIYLEIENGSNNLEVFDDDKIDSNGLGESTCFFCRGGNTDNYHEADILMWAVKETADHFNETDSLEEEGNSNFSFPLRNLAGQTCVSYFVCGHTVNNINIKITDADKNKKYIDTNCKCTDKIAHLLMGSMLTMKEGLNLEISVDGNKNVVIVCDCSIAKGGSLSLVHYHVKSYDSIKSELPFSMDILGWTAI